jgi:hypothetical protein
VATITLLATKHTHIVVFEDLSSTFNKGIVMQAVGGVVLSENVITSASPTLLWTGTGTLTITRDKSLITTNQLLSITADDFDFQSKVMVSSGSASTVVKATSVDHTISIGSTSKDMHITDAEFGSFSSELGLEIGSTTSGDIFVNGVNDSNSDDIGLILLRSTKATRAVNFVSDTSSFNKGITLYRNTYSSKCKDPVYFRATSGYHN